MSKDRILLALKSLRAKAYRLKFIKAILGSSAKEVGNKDLDLFRENKPNV
jgi:hypothetical protein